MFPERIVRPLLVTVMVSVTCSLLVSIAAVGLRDRQEANRQRDLVKNILIAADLYEEDMPLEEAFSRIDMRVVDLDTGAYVSADDIDPATYDQRAAAADADRSDPIPAGRDIARLGRRERYASVGLIRDEGRLDQVLLPIRGKGLWSTMAGIIALDADGNTIRGMVFYEQAETAGLGAEIVDPEWLAHWVGKQVYGPDGAVRFELVKGPYDPDDPHTVDALSGATLTCNGVTDLVRFWLSDLGYKPFLDRIRAEEGATR